MLTVEKLRAELEYDALTGIFTRRSTSEIAGCDNEGYWAISVGNKQIRAHRLAWFYVHGTLPKYIDHIDMNRANNAIANLRPATASQNHANSRMYANNKVGFKGVSYLPNRAKPYRATIGLGNGKTKTIGYASTPEDAHAMYVAKASEIHGEFARAA